MTLHTLVRSDTLNSELRQTHGKLKLIKLPCKNRQISCTLSHKNFAQVWGAAYLQENVFNRLCIQKALQASLYLELYLYLQEKKGPLVTDIATVPFACVVMICQ